MRVLSVKKVAAGDKAGQKKIQQRKHNHKKKDHKVAAVVDALGGYLMFLGNGSDGKPSRTKRIGTTEPMQILYMNDIKFDHTFKIIDFNDKMAEEFDVLLGVDILPKLHIYLSGVAHCWDNDSAKEEDQFKNINYDTGDTENNNDEYSSSESYQKDIDTAPNRDNAQLISEFEDELADMEVDKNLKVYDRNMSDEEFIDDTQTFKNPTRIGASGMKFKGLPSLKGSEAPGYPQYELYEGHKSPKKNYLLINYCLKAKEINYEKKLNEMRDRVDEIIEFDEADSLDKVTQLNEKIKFMENILQGVCNNLTYKDKSHNSNEITVRHQKSSYQMKLTDTRKNVATFANVEDFIEEFEALFDCHGYEINRHWDVTLRVNPLPHR
ncbi:hypothetical protein [Parasitella parasitica]|uniref:Uncharacterized protein n=1 Tax=Parasitella parasitica TaxID=35722 RepID=A0A0B7N3D5_9FUNG|nr:hypothetical protein [Parasitella parasitica]